MYYAVFSAGTNPEVSKETPKALSYATFFALQSAHLSFIQFCSSVNLYILSLFFHHRIFETNGKNWNMGKLCETLM